MSGEVGECRAGEVEYVVGYVACDADRYKDLCALVDAEVMRNVFCPEHTVLHQLWRKVGNRRRNTNR